jgi:hypothetical protein
VVGVGVDGVVTGSADNSSVLFLQPAKKTRHPKEATAILENLFARIIEKMFFLFRAGVRKNPARISWQGVVLTSIY